jgi:hypothetical protein
MPGDGGDRPSNDCSAHGYIPVITLLVRATARFCPAKVRRVSTALCGSTWNQKEFRLPPQDFCIPVPGSLPR